MEDQTTNAVEIALLKKDVSQLTGLFTKFDAALDRLAEVSTTIKQLLAVHDTKINIHGENQTHMFKLINENQQDVAARLDKLDDRLNRLEKFRWMFNGGAIMLGGIAGLLTDHLSTIASWF